MDKSVPPMRSAAGKVITASGRRLPGASSTLTIESPALCTFSRHVCMRNRLEGFAYCSRHILEDESSPYRRCTYKYSKSGRVCPEAVLQMDRRDCYCAEHAYKLMRAQKHNRTKKSLSGETPQSLLAEIECHLGATSKSSGIKPMDSLLSHNLANDAANSGSEDELSSQLMHNLLACQDDVDSDAESIDSEQENALKHAGVYTAEEVALIFRDKLIRLQSLYIDQFKRLHHRLSEKRREYLRGVRTLSKEQSVETTQQDVKSRALQSNLSALRRYHRRFGKESLLMRQLKERRMAIYESATYKPPQYTVCEHSSDGVQCTNRVLPLSKFCIDHIMNDSRQRLFCTCNYADACSQPVAAVSSRVSRCRLHMQLDSFEYRYGKRENQVIDNKEEIVDVVDLQDETQPSSV